MKLRVLGVLFILAGLYGCAATPEAETAPSDQPQTAGAETGGQAPQVSPLDDPNSPLSKKVFYFPYDSSEIAAADRETLSAHAKFIAANPGVSVVAEGHADERGSREYNLALGERRAQAVQRLLMLQGAAQGQSKVVSYGEERPVATGNDESAWRLNRRVELLYSGY